MINFADKFQFMSEESSSQQEEIDQIRCLVDDVITWKFLWYGFIKLLD